jgi:hypothetical protein
MRVSAVIAFLVGFISLSSFAQIQLETQCEKDILELVHRMALISYSDNEPYCNFVAHIKDSGRKSDYSESYNNPILEVEVRYEEAIFALLIHPHLDDDGCLIEEIKYSAP